MAAALGRPRRLGLRRRRRRPRRPAGQLGSAGDILMAPRAARRRAAVPRLPPRCPARYLPNGCMPASGSFIRWFQREVAAGAPLAKLDAEADAVGPGRRRQWSRSRTCSGRRRRSTIPDARGAFTGRPLDHTRGHLPRRPRGDGAGFRHHLDVFAELALPAGASERPTVALSRICGSRWWRRRRDPLETLSEAAGSELGAAFAAGMGAGVFRRLGRDRALRGRLTPSSPTREPTTPTRTSTAPIAAFVPGAAARWPRAGSCGRRSVGSAG